MNNMPVQGLIRMSLPLQIDATDFSILALSGY
jgi:hypothetical protein